jgi:hypothetical protein
MWTTQTKLLSFNGTAMVSVGTGAPPLPLRGVLVDVYRFYTDPGGERRFELLLTVPTSDTGDFAVVDAPVPLGIQTVIPGSPPYTPVELVVPSTLPNLAFRVAAHADVTSLGAPAGEQLIEIYDERDEIDDDWLAAHPDRINVVLFGSPTIQLLLPEDAEEAFAFAAPLPPPSPVPGNEVHLLRVGRAIRDEIGELGESRPNYADYVGKPGYLLSSNVRTVNVQPSFFPNRLDAPFGGTLQIGGILGANFLTPTIADRIYYTVSFARYVGSPSLVFDPTQITGKTQLLDPLFNKRYLLPTPALPNGKWETLHLGPFDGTDTGSGQPVKVYKRPPLADLTTEYWPFWDLMAIWNSRVVENDLVVLLIELYEHTGGTESNPDLTQLTIAPSPNDHLPLRIDNRRPMPRMFDWRTAYATFVPESVAAIAAFDPCGEMPVTPGQVNGNECILVNYSVEDGNGVAHPHLRDFAVRAEFTPRQVAGAPPTAQVPLRGRGGNATFVGPGPGGAVYDDIDGSYSLSMSPPATFEVYNHESVLVPQIEDGWPPEPLGDPPSPCNQYAVEVYLTCTLRTVNGWGSLFGRHHTSRHIIIKR